MTTFTADFESYADAQNIDTATHGADAPFSAVSTAGAATITATSNAIKGTRSMLVSPDPSVAGNACSATMTLGNTYQVAFQFRAVFTGWPSAAMRLVSISPATGLNGNIVLSVTGGVNLTSTTSSTLVTGPNLSLNTLYRFVGYISNGSGATDTMELHIYPATGTTEIGGGVLTATNANLGTGFSSRFVIGKLGTAIIQPMTIDGIQVIDGTTTLPTLSTALPPSPSAAFSSFVTGLNAAFTSSATGSALSYFWTFGDGTTSPAQNPTHAYTTDGTYSVTLTVTDSAGQTSLVTHSVVVSGTYTVPTAATTTGWVNNGGAATSLAAVQDSLDATYIEYTSPNPGSADFSIPLSVASSQGIDVTIRCQRTTSTSGTMSVILKQGATAKATKTGIAIPTTLSDVVVSFLPSDLTTVTDFSTLVCHIDATAA